MNMRAKSSAFAGRKSDAVSATATTRTPAAASSAATWKLSGPFPATSTRAPAAIRGGRGASGPHRSS